MTDEQAKALTDLLQTIRDRRPTIINALSVPQSSGRRGTVIDERAREAIDAALAACERAGL